MSLGKILPTVALLDRGVSHLPGAGEESRAFAKRSRCDGGR